MLMETPGEETPGLHPEQLVNAKTTQASFLVPGIFGGVPSAACWLGPEGSGMTGR